MSEELQRQLAALRAEYLETTKQQIQPLQAAADWLAAGTPPESELYALRQRVHKLRGSGGFYGFAQVSEAAAALEDQLLLVLQGGQEYNGRLLGQCACALAEAIDSAR